MNKTKAKGLIDILDRIDDLVGTIQGELLEANIEEMLSYVYDYTSITRKKLKEVYHIK